MLHVRRLSRLTGIWTLADQGAVSGGTFLSNLILARMLAPADYGVYALIFSGALFLNNVFYAVVAYPLSIRGAVADVVELRRLTLEALCVGALVALPLGAVTFGIAFLTGRPDIGLPAVAAIAGWQLQETLRRALLAHLRHRTALVGDGLSYVGQVVVIWSLSLTGGLSASSAFVAMAATSLLGGLVQANQLGLRLRAVDVRLKCALQNAWRIGRWLMLTNFISGIGFQTFPWVLAIAYGPAETAAFQAVGTAINVGNPVAFSIVNQLVPAAARARTEHGLRAAINLGLRHLARGGALLVPYYVVLFCWPGSILMLLYGPSSPYLGLTSALRVASVASLFAYLAGILAALLMSFEENRKVFVSQLMSVVGFGLGVPFGVAFGVTGAYLGILSTYLIRSILTVAQVSQIWRRSAAIDLRPPVGTSYAS